jgi:hypothetical protein
MTLGYYMLGNQALLKLQLHCNLCVLNNVIIDVSGRHLHIVLVTSFVLTRIETEASLTIAFSI